jgi:glycosyltransferase involved in cell wall biosynthesis
VPPLPITFINPSGEIGGAERSLLLLLEGLDRGRYAPLVFVPAAGRLLDALSKRDVPTRVVPLGPVERLSRFAGSRSWQKALSDGVGMGQAVRELLPALQAAGPALIHTNGIKAHLIGGVCGRLLRRPVVWHMRDLVPEGPLLSLFRAAAGCLPRRIIVNSGAVADQFAGSRAARRTRIVHNAVDLAQYRPSRAGPDVRAELGLAPGAVVLAMVAHFTCWKGHHLFLEVIDRLVRRGLPVAGLIVGGSIYRSDGHQDYESEVRDHCRSLGLERHVVFTGYQECVADYLNAADLLVHPPTRPEPFGRVLIEAMALSKPVVAAAAGGVLEIVEPQVTGLLVPPGEVEPLAAAVQSLVCDPARRAAMGEQGRRRVAQRFSPEQHVAQIQQVYRETGAV